MSEAVELRIPKPTPSDGDAAAVAAHLRGIVVAVARRERPPTLLAVRLLAQPRTILGALEATSWGCRLGGAAAPEAAESVEALLGIDRSAVLADARLCRLWALALTLAAGEQLERWRLKAESIAAELAPVLAVEVTEQDGLDRALAGLVLQATTGVPHWPAEALPELLDIAGDACDAIALAYLLAHGAGTVAAASAVRRSSWLELFSSMTPRSLPYGWVSGAVGEQRDAADYEIAGMAALLGLHATGLATIRPPS